MAIQTERDAILTKVDNNKKNIPKLKFGKNKNKSSSSSYSSRKINRNHKQQNIKSIYSARNSNEIEQHKNTTMKLTRNEY